MALEKAKLFELDQDFKDKKGGGQVTDVQFNPESLKLTYANQLEQPKGGDQGSGNGGRQFVGGGTTKLALQLWFDVTAMQENPVDDVRRLTKNVVYFMNAQDSTNPKDKGKKVPPGVRFSWGSFLFDGMIEGMEETIEFFSPEGKALRASISLTMSQQKILIAEFKDPNNVPQLPGRTPLTRTKQGDSVQNMANKHGNKDWQAVAAANGIEDPLRLPAGQLINLNAGMTANAGGGLGASSFSASLGISGSMTLSGNADIKTKGLNASLTAGF